MVEVVLDVAEGDAGELVHAPEMAALTAADNAPSACRLFIQILLAFGFWLLASGRSGCSSAVGFGPAGPRGFWLWEGAALAPKFSSFAKRCATPVPH
jgi:hypothetical protein